MVTKLVNSNIIIGRVFDRYVIDYSDFIARVPNWVHAAMRDLNIHQALVDITETLTVEDYKVDLPSRTKKLIGVSYANYRIPRFGAINEQVTDDMPTLRHDSFKYELKAGRVKDDGTFEGDGYLILPIEECEIKAYTKALPIVKDDTTQLWFPLIPDDEKLFDAIDYYILMRILLRGHKIKQFNLRDNNPFINPAIAWETKRKKAKNSVNKMDADQRDRVSRLIRTFLVDYNSYYDGMFNPKTTTPNETT